MHVKDATEQNVTL